MKKIFVSTESAQTLELAQSLGKAVSKGISISLKGDLGAGKTTFVQGFAKGLGVSDDQYITSPTYTIINEYPVGDFTLCHLDLYRLGSYEELIYTGFEDLLTRQNIIVVEWPEILQEERFAFDLKISFKFDAAYNRIITLIPSGQAGSNLLSNLSL